jgi:hypothetical protein
VTPALVSSGGFCEQDLTFVVNGAYAARVCALLHTQRANAAEENPDSILPAVLDWPWSGSGVCSASEGTKFERLHQLWAHLHTSRVGYGLGPVPAPHRLELRLVGSSNSGAFPSTEIHAPVRKRAACRLGHKVPGMAPANEWGPTKRSHDGEWGDKMVPRRPTLSPAAKKMLDRSCEQRSRSLRRLPNHPNR